MPKKQRKKPSAILEYRQLPIDALHARIHAAAQRGDFRAAIDIAKECHRREPTPAHAQLLSAQYQQRARQLLDKGLAAEAMAVLGHALQLGGGSAEVLRLSFECGLRSGDYASAERVIGRLQDEAERSRARVMLVDRAVATGDAGGRIADPDLREDVARIRRAFEAFERADDAAVSAELKQIGLHSPCAAWKWLVMGLSAQARNEPDAAGKCWSRVSGEGAAARLAASLAAGLEQAGQTPGSPSAVSRAKTDVVRPLKPASLQRSPRLDALREIKSALDRGRRDDVLRHCRTAIGLTDAAERAAFAQRLGRAVISGLAMEPDDRPVLQRLFGALPEDPRYTRAVAVTYEEDALRDALYGWEQYLRELPIAVGIPAARRNQARALIYAHLGKLAEGLEPSLDIHALEAFFGAEDEDFDDEISQAASHYRKSITLDPHRLATHARLLDLLTRRGDLSAAEEQANRILESWPDHVKSLLFAGQRCMDRNALRKALGYFDRAREAEPFNSATRDAIRTCLMLSARRRLEKGNLPLARKDYEQAAALSGPGSDSVPLYCKWAALEWRAGDAARAESLLEEARGAAADPLLLHYQLAIGLARAAAPVDVRNRFEKVLADHWKAQPSAASAASVASLTSAHEECGAEYDGYAAHRRACMEYLRRALELTDYTADQLLTICQSLRTSDEHALAAAFAEKGATLYPEKYRFALALLESQIAQGKLQLSGKQRKLVQASQQHAEDAGDLVVAQVLRHLLDVIRRSGGGLRGRLASLVAGFRRGRDGDDADLDDDFDLMPPPRRRKQAAAVAPPVPDELLFPELFESPSSGTP